MTETPHLRPLVPASSQFVPDEPRGYLVPRPTSSIGTRGTGHPRPTYEQQTSSPKDLVPSGLCAGCLTNPGTPHQPLDF